MRSTAGRRNERERETAPGQAQVDKIPARMRQRRGETCLERWKHIAARASISGVAGLNITRNIIFIAIYRTCQ